MITKNRANRIMLEKRSKLIKSIDTQINCLQNDITRLKAIEVNEPEKLKWQTSELINIQKLLDGTETIFFNFITTIDRGG